MKIGVNCIDDGKGWQTLLSHCCFLHAMAASARETDGSGEKGSCTTRSNGHKIMKFASLRISIITFGVSARKMP